CIAIGLKQLQDLLASRCACGEVHENTMARSCRDVKENNGHCSNYEAGSRAREREALAKYAQNSSKFGFQCETRANAQKRIGG
ncbi:MAG: hypothetical protein ACI8W8_000311, partial [Rhodothermales bacterium]